jgi:hypothetical protein
MPRIALLDGKPGFAALETLERAWPPSSLPVEARAGWFRLQAATAPAGDPLVAVAADGTAALALVRRNQPRLPPARHELGGLDSPYSCRLLPVLAPGTPATALAELGHGLATQAETDIIDLPGLDADAPETAALATGLATAGWHIGRYDHFINHYEPVTGFDAWLALRPPALRNTLARKTRALTRGGEADLTILTGEAAAAAAPDYEAVYRESWKQPEPFPDFMPGLIRYAGETGCLRLGLCRIGGRAAAVQVWLVAAGRATLFKLAHDRRHDRLSPGTVLTGHMIRHVIDIDDVMEIDFGRGDDPYKGLWLSGRRRRIGLVAANPLRWRGQLAGLRHLVLPGLMRGLRPGRRG